MKKSTIPFVTAGLILMVLILLFAGFMYERNSAQQILPKEGIKFPEEINMDLTGDEEEDTDNVNISLDPESSRAYWKKGVDLRKEGKFGESLKTLQEASLMNPGKPGILYSLGRTYMKMGMYDEALNSLKKSVDISPTPRAWYLMGIIYGFRQNYRKSLESFDESLKLEPSVSALYGKANTLDDMDRDQEAVIYYDKALELNQNNPAVWYSRGIVLNQLNRYGEAKTSFQMAAELNYSRAGHALEVLKNRSQ